MKKILLFIGFVIIGLVAFIPVLAKQDNKITICHHADDKVITITIDESALPAHLAHNDTIGPCSNSSNSSEGSFSTQSPSLSSESSMSENSSLVSSTESSISASSKSNSEESSASSESSSSTSSVNSESSVSSQTYLGEGVGDGMP